MSSAQTKPTEPKTTAEFGKAYKIGQLGPGPNGRVYEQGRSRIITLNSAFTTLAMSTESEAYVAEAGAKLVVIRATIKNPEKKDISLGPSNSFGARLIQPGFSTEKVKFVAAITRDNKHLNTKLASGKSLEIQQIYQFPYSTPSLKLGIYYDNFYPSDAPKFDLSNKLDKPNSPFAKSALEYVATAKIKSDEFSIDGYQFKIIAAHAGKDNGNTLLIQITNTLNCPRPWGFQYADVFMYDIKGVETRFYPNFFADDSFADAKNMIPPGKSVTGEYRFYPNEKTKIDTIKINFKSTSRELTVELPDNLKQKDSGPGK